jgi:hypothetical protein
MTVPMLFRWRELSGRADVDPGAVRFQVGRQWPAQRGRQTRLVRRPGFDEIGQARLEDDRIGPRRFGGDVGDRAE